MSHNSHRTRKLLPAIILVVLSLFLASCSSNTAPSGPSGQVKYGGDIKVGLNADLFSLDPVKSTALVDRQVMLNMYDTLVKVNQKNEVIPDLATAWNYQSPTDLIFTLRTDVKFHDGTPFNADAVVFNINRILADTASPRLSEISAVKEVKAVDASHVEFVLKQAFSPLLAALTDRAGMILSPTAIQKVGAQQLATTPTGAGSGPFKFVEWVKADHILLQRNTAYWQKDAQGNQLPYLNSIRYRPITNGNVEYNNLETSNIDVADSLDPNFLQNIKANPGLIYKQQPGLSFFGLQLNVKAAPLDDVHVRRAIAWGIDAQELLTQVNKDVGVLSHGPISPTHWAYRKDFTPYSHNADKAKAELALSGKTSVSFTLLITSNSPINLLLAQYIQSELQNVGIKVEIKQEVFATLLSDTQAHNFQAAAVGWSGRPDPDGNLYSWFHTGGGNNNMQYSNAQVDKLLEDARLSTDQKLRTTAYQQAEEQIQQDVPYVFTNHGVVIQASTTKIKNFTLMPTGIMDFLTVQYG
jgi:peptide/nickel transport system substrate-binding protein